MVTTITEQIWASSDYAPLAERVSPAIAPLITSLQESLKGRVGATVLDIGAGHGHLTRQLIANGYDVTALEPVQAMIDVGQRFCPKATWMRAFAEDTGLADESFDAIASNFGSFICTNDAVGTAATPGGSPSDDRVGPPRILCGNDPAHGGVLSGRSHTSATHALGTTRRSAGAPRIEVSQY